MNKKDTFNEEYNYKFMFVCFISIIIIVTILFLILPLNAKKIDNLDEPKLHRMNVL